MSQPAISKHLKILERGPRVASPRRSSAARSGLKPARWPESDFLEKYRAFWEGRYRQLDKRWRYQPERKPSLPPAIRRTDARPLTLSTPSDRGSSSPAISTPRAIRLRLPHQAELVRRWLLGPPGWTMPICDIDLGWVAATAMSGAVPTRSRDGDGWHFPRDHAAERLVTNGLFDEDWTGGETLVTTVFYRRAAGRRRGDSGLQLEGSARRSSKPV